MTRTAHTPTSSPTRAARTARRRGAATALVAAIGVLALATAAAAADPVPVDMTTGLTAPAGIMRDVHGDIWVSDSHGGICRLVDPPHAPGQAMVPSPYCDPAPAAVRIGAVAPGQLAFDAESSTLFVGDGASGSGGVWRMHLDQAQTPAVIVSAEKILDLSGPLVADRVFAMSYYEPTHALDFTTKNSPNVQRIVDPATCAPCTSGIVGSAETKAVGSMTHDATGRVYLTDLSGVTSFMPVTLDTQARPVAGLAGAYSALAFDPVQEGGLVYAGATNLAGVDQIDRLKLATGEISTYSTGFDAVTAIGITGSGGLDVLDDPGIKQVGEDLGGTARRFSVPFEVFQPRPTIVDGPPNITNQRTVTFYFTYPTSTTFFCSIDGAPMASCGSGTQGNRTHADLADGPHRFKLQVGNTLTGQSVARRFVIDTVAPSVSIDDVAVAERSAVVAFSADDINVDFACRIDGGAPTVCDSPARFGSLGDGVHSVTVQATDFVGNQGLAVTTSFRIGPPSPPPWKPGAVTATLRGRTLRVVFNAPPGASYARFVLTRKPVYPVRTKPVRIKGGRRNTIEITLSRAEARRLQGRRFRLRIESGPTRSQLTTSAGHTTLRIVARLGRGVH